MNNLRKALLISLTLITTPFVAKSSRFELEAPMRYENSSVPRISTPGGWNYAMELIEGGVAPSGAIKIAQSDTTGGNWKNFQACRNKGYSNSECVKILRIDTRPQ